MLKIFSVFAIVIGSVSIAGFGTTQAIAETQAEIFEDTIKLTRGIVAKQRNDLVLKNMGLTTFEEKSFFGVYNAYRDEMKPLLDQEVKLITDYADTHVNKNLTDKQALNFAIKLLDLKSKKIELRRKYIDEFKGEISLKHIARFIQLENKLDAVMNYDIARQVPLVPVK